MAQVLVRQLNGKLVKRLKICHSREGGNPEK